MTPAPTKLKGFTPVIDVVVKDVGLVQAAVFGAVWRYCQMKDRTCTASLEKIGGRVELSSRTVLRHIKELCDRGYLTDLTPGLRNQPHTYADTGKAALRVVLQAGFTSDLGATESHTRYDRESQPGMTESQLKKPIKKDDTKKDSEPDGSVTPSKPTLFTALAEVCQIDIDKNMITVKQRGQLNSESKRLRKAGIDCAGVRAFGEWWYAHYWLGLKQQPPDPSQIRSMWKQFKSWKPGGNGNGAYPDTVEGRMAMIHEWGQREG